MCNLRLKIEDQLGVPVGKQKLTIPGMEEPYDSDKEISDLKNIQLQHLK